MNRFLLTTCLSAAVAVAVTATVAVAMAPATASPPDASVPGGPPSPAAFLSEHAEELGIDEATLGVIAEMEEARQPEIQQARAAVIEETAQLHELVGAEEPDREAVMLQVEILGDAEETMRKLRLGLLLDVRGLLTPTQQDALQELLGEQMEDMRGRSPWGGRPGPRGSSPFGPPFRR